VRLHEVQHKTRLPVREGELNRDELRPDVVPGWTVWT